MLTKEQWTTPPCNVRRVELPHLQSHCFVRRMDGSERAHYEIAAHQLSKSEDMAPLMGFLAALTLCDEKGERLFTDTDDKALMRGDGTALSIVFQAACEHNLLGAAAVRAEAKN
jgi:hypothetical protein